jgi:double-stranded RNA-binding protein Staufen
MYSQPSGYSTYAVYPKNNSPVATGMAYLGTTESALYRQPTPANLPRGHTTYVGLNPVHNPGFSRPGGVTAAMYSSPTQGITAVGTAIDQESQNPNVENPADTLASSGDSQQAQQQKTLANTKEKTPMCLINELARYNKVQHQYCLIDEQGPAHKKTFFVKLKLGETEEFSSSGPSIKKAQHAAAKVALEQTKYPHPTPKRQLGATPASSDNAQAKPANSSVTPTVELNALAMKRGEMAVYRTIERKPVVGVSQPPLEYKPGLGGPYNSQRLRFPRPPHRFSVALTIGEREFVGEGETMQAARHCAAAMALKVLNCLPMPTREPANKSTSPDNGEAAGAVVKNEMLKSEISLVHEIALKRNFAVEFEIIKESGPPHMRTFLTGCKCGEMRTEGEGSSKKLSKKRAAEKMVEELGKLPPLPPTPVSAKHKKTTKPKQSKNLVKTVLNNNSAGINPISRLIQIQQAKKEKEPTFILAEEKGLPRAREFHIQVTVGDNVCTGVGPNKKLAKRSAAEQMLQLLGFSLLAPQPPKPAIRSTSSEDCGTAALPTVVGPNDKKVKFVDPESSNPQNASRQNVGRKSGSRKSSSTAASTDDADGQTQSDVNIARPMDNLFYVAKIMNFKVSVSEYQQESEEFICVVSIGGNAGQTVTYNGSGATADMAKDNAASSALEAISKFGLVGQSSQ